MSLISHRWWHYPPPIPKTDMYAESDKSQFDPGPQGQECAGEGCDTVTELETQTRCEEHEDT